MTDMRSIRRAILNREIAALKAECLAFDAALRQARLGLWLRYDPDQPRVPAGSADGGQWTSGGGGGGVGAADPSGSAGDEAGTGGDASGSAGGGSEWTTIARGVTADGSRTETVARSDGTTIRSEYAASPAVGFDERHTVSMPDGSQRTFENERLRQTIRDELGEVLSRSEFRPDGAVLEPAFLPTVPVVAPWVAPAVGKTVQLSLVLLTAISTRNGPSGQAVAAFSSRDYVAPEAAPYAQPSYVGRLSRDEVELVCRRITQVQTMTDAGANAFARERAQMSPQNYGTAVHTHVKYAVEALGDPNFRAERSLLKEQEWDTYGRRDTIRIDVFERSESSGTVCVYDIKTGGAILRPGRSGEIRSRVWQVFGPVPRIIVTEIRPRQ
jgi:hypothetical protein